ncbi:MAG TPA: ATP-binding cassette domain-containing protein [Fibrobacteraceae bacterium]|nr:ATP-binding cassette domain-containing protein [Fibrobacteraceae bacterium]
MPHLAPEKALLLRYLHPRLWIGAVCCGILNGACVILIAWTLSRILSGLVWSKWSLHELWPWLWLAFGGIGLRFLLSSGQALLGARLAAFAKTRLRRDFFPGPDSLEPNSTEMTWWLRGVESLDAWFSQYWPQRSLAVLVPLLLVIPVWFNDPLSAMVFTFTAPLLPLFLALIGTAAREKTRRQWKLLLQQGNLYLETLLGLRTLRLFGQGGAWGLRLQSGAEQLRQRTIGVLRLAFLSALTLELVGTLGTAIIAVEVGLRLLHGSLDFATAIFVLLLAPEFYAPLRLLGLRTHAAMEGEAVARRLIETSVPKEPLPKFCEVQNRCPDGLCLRVSHVGTRWPGTGQMVFRDISLEVQRGERIGIAGASGCGKSSLLALLFGELPLLQGEIQKKEGLRLGWVPQCPHLWAASLRANVLAVPETSTTCEQDELIWEVLSCVGLLDFVRHLPQALDTLIGEGGTRLSGGQQRRLALARTLFRPVDLLLMDEPDAHLDQESLISLDRVWHTLGMTSLIFVSHREASLAQTHRVLYMENGRMVDFAPHERLLHRWSTYRSLLQTEDPE